MRKERITTILKEEKIDKITTEDMEVALVEYCRLHNKDYFCTKGVSSTLGHECDFVYLTKGTLYANEIEIKISLADLKADKKKKHEHDSNLVKTTSFIIPKVLLEKSKEHIDEKYGIYTCEKVERILKIEEYDDWNKYAKEIDLKREECKSYEEYREKREIEYNLQREKWKKTKRVKYKKQVKFFVSQVRKPKNKKARKLNYEEAFNLGRLCSYKYWELRKECYVENLMITEELENLKSLRSWREYV